MSSIVPREASGAIHTVGEVKIIFYDNDFNNSDRPEEGKIYHGGKRSSVYGRPDGVAMVPSTVDVRPDSNLADETFYGFVKVEDLDLVEQAIQTYPPDKGVLKFKVSYVSRRFRYRDKTGEEVMGVNAKAYCWVDAKKAA